MITLILVAATFAVYFAGIVTIAAYTCKIVTEEE